MFPINNQMEWRRVTMSSLITCIYLPIIITVISYNGLLYSVGSASSFYILVLIFVSQLLKAFYLNSPNDLKPRKSKPGKNKVGEIVKSFLFLLVGMFSFFVGIILFGAPILDCHEETLMLSALLTLLTMFPLVAHAGPESSMQLLFGVKNYAKDTIAEMLVNNALLTVGGAWLGAVVIPLDWNTPWQQWPVPCYLGAIGGYLLSNILVVLKSTLMSLAVKYPAVHVLINVWNKAKGAK